jgi:hypothetical protein
MEEIIGNQRLVKLQSAEILRKALASIASEVGPHFVEKTKLCDYLGDKEVYYPIGIEFAVIGCIGEYVSMLKSKNSGIISRALNRKIDLIVETLVNAK